MLKKWINNKVDAMFKQVFNDNVDQINLMFSALERKTQNINHRIDNLILSNGGTSPTEVTDARVGANGTSHATLKKRLDQEFEEHRQRINANDQALAESQIQTNLLQDQLNLLYSREDQVDLYVSATRGSDTTGNGSSEKPFRTIQQAVNHLPMLSSSVFWIWCESGRYLEDVNVKGVVCAEIHISSIHSDVLNSQNGDTDVFIRSISFYECQCYCRTRGLTFVDTANAQDRGVVFSRCNYGAVDNCRFSENTRGRDYSAVQFDACKGRVYGSFFVNQHQVLLATFMANVELANSNTGNQNNIVLRVGRSIAFANGLRVTGDTILSPFVGGQIFQ